jgi:antitoxin (DNA-binding transcriptional repressor) of toxin-antitoxin stability system
MKSKGNREEEIATACLFADRATFLAFEAVAPRFGRGRRQHHVIFKLRAGELTSDLVLKMMYHLGMKTTTMAYAKAHLPKLIERVARGERITIMRYKKPVAELGPSPAAETPKRKFGTGKGKAFLIDPDALKPMTDEEVDAFLERRY